MSDTPITDANRGFSTTVRGINYSEILVDHERGPFVYASLAEILERERAEWRHALESLHPTGRGTPAEMARDLREGMQAARDALAEGRTALAAMNRQCRALQEQLAAVIKDQESNTERAPPC